MTRFLLAMKRPRVLAFLLPALVLAIVANSVLVAGASPVQSHFNYFLRTHYDDEELYDDNSDVSGGAAAALAQEQYDDRAYPNAYVGYDQSVGAANAFQSVSTHQIGGRSWHLVGPKTTNVPSPVTYTGANTTVSGRMTAIVVGDPCTPTFCQAWVGAAGGGVWTTYHALDQSPQWHSSSDGLTSNAIGSLALDPSDPSGNTLYVGTGEANGSSDSEAGLGLFKSTDRGQSWHLVPGSVPAAKDRAIGAIAIDPSNSKHIYIGTDVARHGTSSVVGGRYTPPGAPTIGLYESLDGGATFKLVFSVQTDVVNPTSPNGSDFFRGGVTKIQFNHTGLTAQEPWQVYFSVFDYGLYRSANGSFEQVFTSAGTGAPKTSAGARTEFALAPNSGKLRVYLGDTDGVTANFYRVDDANVPAASLTDGTNNPGWLQLSNATPGTAGYASYDFCNGQCSYDMWVASPPGRPDTVWIGGSMQYGEIFTANPPSNGRAVQRSVDAGVDFTDMTDDSQSPPVGLHPDQHAVAFASSNPDIAFLGSDGGIVRTSGSFVDGSADCAKRGIAGADLTDCQAWLKQIPTTLYSLNAGLSTLQFQSLTVNPHNADDVMGGTQDNGTLVTTNSSGTWTESVGGDGGQSVIDVGNANARTHAYYGPQLDANFRGTDPLGWDWISDPLVNSKEAASFYVPLIGDPKVAGTEFVGLEHVWRTQDNGGSQAYLDKNCSEFGTALNGPCGDWVPLGTALDSTTFGTDKNDGNYVVAIQRTPSNNSTLWAATRRGRVFISTNADAANPADVSFTRLDTSAQPTRFVSGIQVDPKNPYHAFVSYSGYSAYTPTTPGHVFDVTYDPQTGKATWKDISVGLGDEPITGIAYDSVTGDLYASSDFGVAVLPANSQNWVLAAPGLPRVAVYGLTIAPSARTLYAATHGRGAWRLHLGS